jgi:uncharacterized protein
VILADVNVLVSAFRADSEHHRICRPWLNSVVSGDAAFGVSKLVLSAVVRITTSVRVFVMPSALDEAFGFCSDLLTQPHARLIEPGDRHWALFQRLCTGTETRGPRVTDAWFAALAIEHGCEWVTLDRDFARFPELRWSAPGGAM